MRAQRGLDAGEGVIPSPREDLALPQERLGDVRGIKEAAADGRDAPSSKELVKELSPLVCSARSCEHGQLPSHNVLWRESCIGGRRRRRRRRRREEIEGKHYTV